MTIGTAAWQRPNVQTRNGKYDMFLLLAVFVVLVLAGVFFWLSR
jgi:hypothetical protein